MRAGVTCDFYFDTVGRSWIERPSHRGVSRLLWRQHRCGGGIGNRTGQRLPSRAGFPVLSDGTDTSLIQIFRDKQPFAPPLSET